MFHTLQTPQKGECNISVVHVQVTGYCPGWSARDEGVPVGSREKKEYRKGSGMASSGRFIYDGEKIDHEVLSQLPEQLRRDIE
ncbi:unnamed protein product, partial [Chrysoparadoxa australica]